MANENANLGVSGPRDGLLEVRLLGPDALLFGDSDLSYILALLNSGQVIGEPSAIDESPLFDSFMDENYYQAKVVGDYMHDEGVSGIVLLDRSARPAHTSIREYYRHRYPNEQLPETYFIDPMGVLRNATVVRSSRIRQGLGDTILDMKREYLRSGRFGRFILARDIERALDMIWEMRGRYTTHPDALEELRGSYPGVMARKELPLLVYDGCIHSGETMFTAKKLLEDSGCKDVRTGVFSSHNSNEGIADVDLVVQKDRPIMGCKPFSGSSGEDHNSHDRTSSIKIDPRSITNYMHSQADRSYQECNSS